MSVSVKTTLFFRSDESVFIDDMASTTDGNIVCMPSVHADIWERKSLTQLWLPQGLAFIQPRKHCSLDSERLPTEKQRQENLKTFVSDIHEQILRHSDLNKCLLYKSYKLLRFMHLDKHISVCKHFSV